MTIPLSSELGVGALGAFQLGFATGTSGVMNPTLFTRPVSAVVTTQVLGGNQAPPPPDHLNYSPSSTLPYGDGG